MKTTTEQRFVRTVLAASIAAIFSVPAFAEDDDVESLIRPDSEVEVGIGHVSQDSFRYGNYTGLHREGAHLIGNVQINKRGADNPSYFRLEGRNLGLDSRSLSIDTGEQGNYGIRLDYDQIPYLSSDSFITPYDGAGTGVLTRPAGVTRAATVGAMTGLAANMKRYDIESLRKGVGIGFTKQLMKGWDVELNYKRDIKEGDKLTAAMIQIGTGGSRGAVLVPEPTDYETDQYEALVRYTDKKLQLQFGYYASLFKNDIKSLAWDNLFTGTGNLTGSYGLPPDNEFHQINASGSYALTGDTRVSGALSFGRMTQNDQFLPYSTGTTAAEGIPANGSLNGKVYATHANLKLTSKLAKKLTLLAGLRYDDRDNKTPIAQYGYYTGDRSAQGPTATNANLRTNMPLDIKKQVYYADLDYHLSSATTLKLGYDFHKVDHNYEPTTGDKEHTVKAEARHRFGDTLSGGLSYAYSDRDASDYFGAAPLASTYTAAYLNTLFGGTTGRTYAWLEAPTLRKYYLADRKRDKVGATANFAPTERLDLQFGAYYNRDKYPDTVGGIGLTRATGWMASFDANLQATDAFSGSFFASIDQYKTDQTGAHLPNATLVAAADQGAIPDTNLGVTTLRDRTLTLGLGVRYKPLRKYELGANFTHSDSVGSSTFVAGSAVPIGPLPDLESRLNRLEMFGRYQLQKDLTVNLKYAYERYSAADWAWDAPLSLASVSSVVGAGNTSPKYNVHFVGVSLSYKF
ncbi:MAG TPA: MtrB/PioB family decaheme-associated outer membrane protein [Noviherbaspirillum sp.]